jgi:hypothetical protein
MPARELMGGIIGGFHLGRRLGRPRYWLGRGTLCARTYSAALRAWLGHSVALAQAFSRTTNNRVLPLEPGHIGRFDMRVRCVLACLFLAPGVLLAQDGIIKDFDAAAMEKFIQQDLRKDFAKKENKQNNTTLYDIRWTDYYATLNGDLKFILFFVKGNAGMLTLQKVNDWNRDAIFSRAYLNNNMFYLEVPVSIGQGVTREILKNYYDQFEAEWKKFKSQ